MEQPSRNIGLDLVRVTETTALAAGRWIGSGDYDAAHRAASRAMASALSTLAIDGRIIIGEEGRVGEKFPLASGDVVGNGDGPEVDVVVDPIDGTHLLIRGQPGAISVVGIAPRDTMWSPAPAVYMEKLIVDRVAAPAIVTECLDAPAAWTLALIARAKDKAVQDLGVMILSKPRHADLIEEVQMSGARVLLRDEGDAEGALEAATAGTDVDVLLGIGGTSEGLIAACAVKSLGGAMLARLAPQSIAERDAVKAAGLDQRRILTADEMVAADEIFFSVTSITDSRLLPNLRFHNNYAETYSLLMRAATGTRRIIHAEHGLRVA